MTDRVLLTGISGFLGSHIALQLLQAGYKVRGSLRNLKRSEEVRLSFLSHGANVDNLEFVSLELLSDDGWNEAMADVNYLCHVASPFLTAMPDDKMELITPAVEGTTRAINAALAADVKRIVLTSSMAAIMYGHEKSRTKPFTGVDWTNVASPDANAYVQSKTLAEQKAWALMEAASRRNDLVSINPSLILGPLLSNDPGPSGELMMRLLTGSIPAAPRLIFPCVDVRDVAAIHIAAMTNKDVGGQRLATSTNSVSILDIAIALKQQLPAYAKKLPKFELPDWVVRLYAFVDADVRSNLSELGKIRTVDAALARELLGHDFTPAQSAIAAMGQSIIDHKLA